MTLRILLGALAITLLTTSCQDNKSKTSNPKPSMGAYTECKDPRPQACTREFRPVCSNVDTGVRCVTTPCPSTTKKTSSNACTACADPKVYGYWANACPE